MTEFKEIKLTELVASSTNPRSEFEENSLNELAESIKGHGVLQPIIVRIHPEEKKKFEVVCGERRFRASKIAGVKTIPVSVRELNDDEVFEIQIIENLERKDVHPMDEAIAFKRMLESGKYSMEDIAAKVAKNVTFVAQRLKLNDLIKELKNDFVAGKFGIGHAVILARVDIDQQTDIFEDYTSGDYPIISDLKDELQDNFLDKAIFDIEDVNLVPEAGPCSTCPKSSFGNPVLFPEMEENRCFDSKCFENKTVAFKSVDIQKIIDENPGIIITASYVDSETEPFIKIATDNGKEVLTGWNSWNRTSSIQPNALKAFSLSRWDFDYITLIGSAKTENISGDPQHNLKMEMINIKQRADRALELDREKIYIRAIKELKENTEKNEALFNTNPLEISEKKALVLAIISYADESWIEELYGEKLGYNDRHQTIDKIFSEEFYNKVIRHYIHRTLVTENIADYKIQDRPAYMHAVFNHYFPKEIGLFTLEQTEIASKRIIKSNARIEVLENEISGNIGSVKRCSDCKKSNDDFLEDSGYPMIWKDDLCTPCSTKSK